jgi:hypothetical protein
MASRVFGAIRETIYSTANSAGGLLKVILGTPGSQLEYPTDPTIAQFKDTENTGQLWDQDGAFLYTVLNQLGEFFDQWFIAWGRISTNATGVAPTVGTDRYIASATKDEGTNSLRINFGYGYNHANDYLLFANEENVGGYTPVIATRNADWIRFTLQDAASNVLTINNRTIMAFIIGYQNP